MDSTKKKANFVGDALVTFSDVAGPLRGEKVLKAAGCDVKLVAPPPEMRMGCDLALEILLAQQQDIERLFKEKNVRYTGIIPLDKKGSPAG